jgi:drug/metabolite transporter (DMT)-like permease
MEAGAAVRSSEKPFGPVAAVFLAAGIGAVVLGILTTLAEANEDVKSALEWSSSVGPLMGKTLIASAGFFIAWVILYFALRRKDPAPKRVFMWTGILVAIGFVLTFPTFFQLFTPEE